MDNLNNPQATTMIRGKSGEVLARDHYEKGKIIFREGGESDDIFIVESGQVGVFKSNGEKFVRLATVEKGAMFGEMAAITKEKRSATTIALVPTVLVRISSGTVHKKISACDPFIGALINLLICNLSRVNDRYVATNKMAEQMLIQFKHSAT